MDFFTLIAWNTSKPKLKKSTTVCAPFTQFDTLNHHPSAPGLIWKAVDTFSISHLNSHALVGIWVKSLAPMKLHMSSNQPDQILNEIQIQMQQWCRDWVLFSSEIKIQTENIISLLKGDVLCASLRLFPPC